MVGATVLVVVVGAVFRLVGNDLPVRVGPALLAVAALVGLPHGTLDTVLLTEGRRPARGALVGVGYLSLAVGTWWVWSRWPFAGLCSLLAVSAAHFAAADLVVQRWRHPRSGASMRTTTCAAGSGVIAVAGPFTWWPTRTGPVLERLGVGGSTELVTTGCRVALALALAAALVALSAGSMARITGQVPLTSAVLEPFVLLALTAVCPPLTALAVYFAGWHALRLARDDAAMPTLAIDGQATAVIAVVDQQLHRHQRH